MIWHSFAIIKEVSIATLKFIQQRLNEIIESLTELQIRGGNEDKSKIIFLISQ